MSIGIKLIGLGTSPDELTAAARRELEMAGGEVVLIGPLPPAYSTWPGAMQLQQYEFADETQQDWEEVVANRLLQMGIRSNGLVAALGGDPLASSIIAAALQKKAEGIALSIQFFPAPGCIQACLALAGVHAADGIYQIHAGRLRERHHPPFSPDMHAFIHALQGGETLENVVRILRHQYPGSMRVSAFVLGDEGGFQRHEIALDALPSFASSKPLHAILVPPMKRESSLESFQETIAHLRADDGCPWDRKQTHQTLRLHLLEETYEALDALDREDLPGLAEELGDLLLQIVLHAQIATEHGSFRMADIVGGIQEKIIHRHPHVFGELDVKDSEEVLVNWEALKQSERRLEGQEESLLNGVARALPALAQAVEIQTRAARVGFEWREIEGVLEKIEEETGELRKAASMEERSAEFGDLLFVMANYARWLDVEPETALREACTRFRDRFGQLERIVHERGKNLQDLTLEEMDAIWDEVKDSED